LELGLMLAGVLIIGAGVFVWRSGKAPQAEVLIAETTTSPAAMVYADISGVVNNSGVYQFTENTRVEEAIKRVRGLSGEADVNWVESNINRAEKVTDGEKIFIPKINIQVTTTDTQTNTNTQITNRISINK
jgi:DNA uptake protein ComE-like DNA-binding protein